LSFTPVAQRDIAALGQRQLRPLRREMQVVFQDPFPSLSLRLSIAQIAEERDQATGWQRAPASAGG
jgi:peptide/nickel transport system ATP-binding protein